MIKEVKMFTVVCDSCGKDVNEGGEYAAWTEIDPSLDLADVDGWYCDDDKHYCPGCFYFDDNDNIIIK